VHWRIAIGDERKACYALRAAEYARSYRNIPLGEFSDELDSATTTDGVALSYIVSTWDQNSLVGTLRLALSKHPSYRDLKSEVSALMDFDWCDIAGLLCMPTEELKIGEAERFAIPHSSHGLRIKWMTITAAGEIAVRLGLHAVLAIMPPSVERVVRRAGGKFHRVSNAQLRRDRYEQNQLLIRYHDYFFPALRRMGLEIDVDKLQNVSSQTIDMLLAGCEVGPVLWWIPAEEMANAAYPHLEA
jgi:hypothetical protein